MITVIILSAIALLVIAATVATVVRDGYGRVPARMATSRLREQEAAQQDLELQARSSVAQTISTARLV